MIITLKLDQVRQGSKTLNAAVHAGSEEAPMSDRARDVWVEHLVNVYMGMAPQEWRHMCAHACLPAFPPT